MLLIKIFKPHTGNTLIMLQALLLLLLLFVGYISPETIVFGYFFETIIIGIIHAVKLFLVVKHGKEDPPGTKSMQGYGVVLFFMVHYGMFVAIQLIFVFSFFSGALEGIDNGFNLFQNFKVLVRTNGMGVMLGSLLLTNLAYFYHNFWTPSKYREYAPSEIFMGPYVRIFIQQFVVILAGFFFVFLNAGYAAAVLLIGIRLLVDLVIVSIKKDAAFLEVLSEKLAKPGQDPSEVKQQLERLSE